MAEKYPSSLGRELPQVGELFFELAENLAGQELSRDMTVSEVLQKPKNGRIETRYSPRAGEMPALGVLKAIRDITSYRGETFQISRQNVQLVARLGGYAAYGVHELLPPAGLSEGASEGIRRSLLTVQGKMNYAFRGTVRPHLADRTALALIQKLDSTIRG